MNSDICGSLGSERADAAVADDVRGLLATGKTELLTYGPEGQRRGEGMRVFAASFAPRPRMLVFGAIDFAAAVARLGTLLGYRVTVDARPVFATRTRFADAHEVIVDWPHRYLAAEADAGRIDSRTAVCVLTHDPKFDVPVLEIALRLPSSVYVGAMGSTRMTHQDRLQRLREAGLCRRGNRGTTFTARSAWILERVPRKRLRYPSVRRSSASVGAARAAVSASSAGASITRHRDRFAIKSPENASLSVSKQPKYGGFRLSVLQNQGWISGRRAVLAAVRA